MKIKLKFKILNVDFFLKVGKNKQILIYLRNYYYHLFSKTFES